MVAKNAMSTTQTIAITGLGLVTPLGTGVAAFDDALRTGRSAVRSERACAELGKWVERPDGTEGRPIMAAPITDFSAQGAIEPQKLRRIPRLAQFTIVAAREALGMSRDAGRPAVALHHGDDRVGLVLGTGLGALDQTVEFNAGYLRGGPEAASPALFPTTVMNTAAAMVAMELHLTGPNITVNHRDLSSVEAVAVARDQLLCGRADAVLAGGFEELGPWLAHAYGRLHALTAEGEIMRPYDRRRGGLCLGEGAVVFLLERLDDARARGAEVLAVLAGVGRAGDDRPRLGWRSPDRGQDIEGAARAVRAALEIGQAGQPGKSGALPDYIAGGGNGTALDELETRVLREALGAAARQVRISSIVGQIGESMVSPGLRLASAVCALTGQHLPGTAGCEDPDPAASLPGLLLRPQRAEVSSVLVPTFAQGGGDVCLLLTR
jgi:3-oxoacyl-[acyl-carrier-protein] synthase II